MAFDPTPYFADISGIDAGELLDEWRWLLRDSAFDVYRATAMGDLILRDPSGVFRFLDMVDGKLEHLAETESALAERLQDRGERQRLLGTFVVRGLRDSGKALLAGQCYSPDHPPILGGNLDDENLQPCDTRVHASMQGQIHKQVKDLPPGTRISDIRIE